MFSLTRIVICWKTVNHCRHRFNINIENIYVEAPWRVNKLFIMIHLNHSMNGYYTISTKHWTHSKNLTVNILNDFNDTLIFMWGRNWKINAQIYFNLHIFIYLIDREKKGQWIEYIFDMCVKDRKYICTIFVYANKI